MQARKFLILVDLLKKENHNTKIEIEIERKIFSTGGSATSPALNAVKNKTPDVSNLVKKNYDAKITVIENKYITTADKNKFTKDIVANNMKSKNFVDKFANSGFISNAGLDKKVAILVTKAELKVEQDRIIKLQELHSSNF